MQGRRHAARMNAVARACRSAGAEGVLLGLKPKMARLTCFGRQPRSFFRRRQGRAEITPEKIIFALSFPWLRERATAEANVSALAGFPLAKTVAAFSRRIAERWYDG